MGKWEEYDLERNWTDAKITRFNEPGLHGLGCNLYLNVPRSARKTSGPPAKQFIVRFRGPDGKRHDMGLGSTRLITLNEARQAAFNCLRLLAKGGDPLAERRQRRLQARCALASLVTWDECVKRFAGAKLVGSSPGYVKRWTDGLARYATPVLGGLPVGAIDDQLIRRVLSPIWSTKPATASKLRGWLEGVIDFAFASGLRQGGANPARWKGHLELVFAHPAKIKPVEHQKALPYTEAPGFFALLKTKDSEVALALRMIILTGGRKIEVLRSVWGQFDFTRKIWSIPPSGTKQREAHHVPLSSGMFEVLDEMRRRCGGHPLPTAPVFPSSRPGSQVARPLSEASPQLLISRLGLSRRTTVHGFRTSLECFIAECTTVKSEARQLMIGHTIGGEVEQAYMRSDLLEQRRKGFEAWSRWLNVQPVDPSVALDGSLAARAA
jgi:integrase